MKPFVFKLQTALDLKLREEEMQKEELQKATDVYMRDLAALEALKTRMLEIQEILRGKQSNTINILEIKTFQDYIPALAARINHQEGVTDNSRQEMDRVRAKLVEIMRERKVLEKLKAKHYQEYMREYLSEEQKLIDEMATNGFMRKDSAV